MFSQETPDENLNWRNNNSQVIPQLKLILEGVGRYFRGFKVVRNFLQSSIEFYFWLNCKLRNNWRSFQMINCMNCKLHSKALLGKIKMQMNISYNLKATTSFLQFPE